MKKTHLIGLALGLVAAGVAGFGYWTAVLAEQQYRTVLAQANTSPTLQLRADNFARSWPRSTVVTQATLHEPALAAADIELAFAHTIYHGLLPVDCPVTDTRQATSPITVQTTLAPQTALTADLIALYPAEQPPLTMWLCSSLDNTLDAELTLAPLKLSHFGTLQQLTFSGLTGQVHQTATGLIEQATLTLGETRLQTAAGQLQAQGSLQIQQFNPQQPTPDALQRAELLLESRGQLLETTLTTLFVEQLRQAATDTPADPAQLARQAAAKTTQLLNLLTASQFLVRTDHGYRLHLLYTDGELRVNDTPRNPRLVLITLAVLIRPLLS